MKCSLCAKTITDKDIISLNKKLFGKKTNVFYCLDCMANYYNVTTDEILDKIEAFKEEGCELFS